MKKIKVPQNIGLKLVAFLFAVVLWMIVVNVDNPVTYTTYSNIPVTVTNESVVTNMGKVYQIKDDMNTVKVTVYAKRSVLSSISRYDIVATADLSQMDLNTYLVPVQVSIPEFDGKYKSAEASPINLQVEIDDKTRNTFPISVSATGTPRDGYVIGEMTTNPEKITIGGSDSLISRIQKVVAKVDVSGISESSVLNAELILYDANGNVMDQSKLNNNLGDEGISVNVEVLTIKSVPLDFKISGTPESGYIYTGWSCVPESIQVCGSKEVLANLNTIEISGSEVNIDGINKRKDVTIDIIPHLPENVRLVDETANNVVVTIGIEQEGTKTLELPVESIKVNNLDEKLEIRFETENDLELQFTGTKEALEVLDIRNAASIDLKSYTAPGTYEIPVKIETAPGITLNKKPTVTVVLTEKKDE